MGLSSHKARQAPPNATAVYVRHRPETALLYQIICEYWPEFQAELAGHGRYLTHKAGYTKASARTGAVTLIQRFGSALNLHIHFHMLFLDGVYIDSTHGSRPRFRWVKAPTGDELTQLTHTIAHRVARYLERQGLLERDAGNNYLTAEGVDADPESPMNQLLGSSITYRIAVGPQQSALRAQNTL